LKDKSFLHYYHNASTSVSGFPSPLQGMGAGMGKCFSPLQGMGAKTFVFSPLWGRGPLPFTPSVDGSKKGFALLSHTENIDLHPIPTKQ